MGFDIDAQIEKAQKGEILEQGIIKMICILLKEQLMKEDNVVNLWAPVIVVGDVHGQFQDLMEIFKIGGDPPMVSYLFLGDYVDRGACSVETITYLVLLKLKYPRQMALLRGNHESRSVTQVYGFFSECQRKFGHPAVWQYFTDLFDFLPLGAVINNRYFCVHGGLSPSVALFEDVCSLNRTQEIPHEGAFTDLMWSDPDQNSLGFTNSSRGAGYLFGRDVVEKFLYNNQLEHIIRAHQLCQEGYQVLFDDRISTVWSAPNYCYRFGNQASILLIDEWLNREFVTFSESPDNKDFEDSKFTPQPGNFLVQQLCNKMEKHIESSIDVNSEDFEFISSRSSDSCVDSPKAAKSKKSE